MTRFRTALLFTLVLGVVGALAPYAGAGSSKPSEVEVVGSGTIVWRQVAVLAKPKAGARRVAVMKQFRPDFRPQYVLALDAVRARDGRALWYRISVPGRPNGRTGRIAVGKPGAETPLGLFYVTDKFSPAIDPDWAILGEFAFETSAYSKLTDWPGGGIVGVHGTPWAPLRGPAVSPRCIRLHNHHVSFLRSRVPVGTPVKIVR